jgi:hypothetical protein
MKRVIILVFITFIYQMAKCQIANRYDVVITEIMADPTPVVGLPAFEYIEIRNRSNQILNLQNWKLSDATGTATISVSYNLKPDSSVVLCGTTAAPQFAVFGPTIGVTSFPSLDNDGEMLSLKSPQNKTIHAVNYSINWHSNIIKKDGGWSLEMKDISKPCLGATNWTSSIAAVGGSIGVTNSVGNLAVTDALPIIDKATATDNVTIAIQFFEPVDSTSAVNITNYNVAPITSILQALPQAPLFNTVLLKLATPMVLGQVYTVSINNIKNCSGTNIAPNSIIQTGITQPAIPGDIIINELLFDPKPNGTDYVEIYNKSNKLINAKELFIANRSGTAVASQKLASINDAIIFPNSYFVITEDKPTMMQQFVVQNPNGVSEIPTMPTYSADKGSCVLLNQAGTILDELVYLDDWHFPLLSNKKGVSLERVNIGATTQNANNWFSAAVSTNLPLSGGTPTYKNSQNYTQLNGNPIVINQKIFSPDGDGFDDLCTINYNLLQTGLVGNIYIHDAQGRQVKHLVKNALLAQQGQFVWNGLGEQNQKLSIGQYIIVTEVFNTTGGKKQYKNVIVLARKLN